jgi:hypothetical protein
MTTKRQRATTLCRTAALLGMVALATTARSAEYVVDHGFDDPSSSAWTLELFGTSSLDWVAEDATGDGDSGSLRVRKPIGEAPNSARVVQCVRVLPGAEVELSARVRAPSQIANGTPFLLAQWWSGSDCTGDYLLELQPAIPPPLDTWTVAGPYLGTAPATAHSAFVYAGAAVTVSVGSPQTWEIDYDDVSLVPEPGAAGGVAALVALACLATRRQSPS